MGSRLWPKRSTPRISPRAWAKACPRQMPTSSTVWWSSTQVSPVQVTVRSNFPWRAKPVSMWSKNPTPVRMS